VYHIKLTDEKGQTYGNTQWGYGVRHEAAPGTTTLCTGTAIHCYSGGTLQEALALAVHMNPIHAGFRHPRAWTFKTEGRGVSDGTKSGYKAGTTRADVPLPKVTLEQRVEVAIRCALKVDSEGPWAAWAEKWLSGEDRSGKAAARAETLADSEWEDGAVLAAVAAAEAARAEDEDDVDALKEAESAAEDEAAWSVESAARDVDIDVANIAASVYYREEEAECTTSS
jgi:hypothetical protein